MWQCASGRHNLEALVMHVGRNRKFWMQGAGAATCARDKRIFAGTQGCSNHWNTFTTKTFFNDNTINRTEHKLMVAYLWSCVYSVVVLWVQNNVNCLLVCNVSPISWRFVENMFFLLHSFMIFLDNIFVLVLCIPYKLVDLNM